MSQSFPTLVYKSGGPHHGPPVDEKSTTYKSKGVADEAEFKAALAKGWSPTLIEAVDPEAAERLAAERAAAKQKAIDDARALLAEADAEPVEKPKPAKKLVAPAEPKV